MRHHIMKEVFGDLLVRSGIRDVPKSIFWNIKHSWKKTKLKCSYMY